MDTCLYFQIQFIDDNEQITTSQLQKTDMLGYNVTTNNLNESPIGQQQQEDNKNDKHNLIFDDAIKTSSIFIPPIKLIDKFSFAFHGMSVKLMMTNPIDNYLLAPLSEALVEMMNFKENLLFITPNMISYAGVVAALIAAKLVTYDSPFMHKLSFFIFQLRTWLDDLDGDVARARMGVHKHSSLQTTSGYVVDGVCDAIGFIAYVLGCYIYMRNSIKRMRSVRPHSRYNLRSITEVKSSSSISNDDQSTYVPLQQECDDFNYNLYHDNDFDTSAIEAEEEEEEVTQEKDEDNQSTTNLFKTPTTTTGGQNLSKSKIYLKKIENGNYSSVIFYRYIKEKIKSNLNKQRLILLILCFLLQLAMCSFFWNRHILVYSDLLESKSTSLVQATIKRKILKSNIMYIIIWFWRLTNGHSLMQMLVVSVWLGKLWQFLDFIKYLGFIEITLLTIVTELHVIDVRNYLTV